MPSPASPLVRPLLALLAALVAADAAWIIAAQVAVDAGAYARLLLLGASLMAGAAFYHLRRPDARLCAMLFGSGFLCVFSLAASLLNYLLLTVAGGRIDAALARMDRALGFDWAAAMSWTAQHPLLNAVLLAAYASMLPQVALLVIALARRHPMRVYRFCAALALSALACIGIWALAPSFGAFSVIALPQGLEKMSLALDPAYARELVRLLQDGPGLISPHDAKGLIGFPSYHAVMALIVAFYAFDLGRLCWPVLCLNALVLVATPIQGGHHLVDVLAAFPVAALALLATGDPAGWTAQLRGSVNNRPIFTMRSSSKGGFRATAAQSHRQYPLGD